MRRLSTKFGVFGLSMLSVMLLLSVVVAQETTGGLQGTVKDASGAMVPNVQMVLTGTSLVGEKTLQTDSSGHYHFVNLPPGTYTITATAQGFSELKREGINIEVGHLPTLDLTLAIGTSSTVVEVSGEAPVIDVTTNINQTNLTSTELNDTPHGYSFQSVIQFAPMARNEPLAGQVVNGMPAGGSGGSLPGSAGNGQSFGYSIGGAADSESTYLVEGQDTENVSGGYSNANVPFQFIQEVQIATSGIQAEHGGALGGVVNVIMKKGSNAYHGSLFTSYESDGMDGNPVNPFLRYDPDPSTIPAGFDDPSQIYQAQKQHFRIGQPGFTVGGPLKKDRLWFFLGFAPEYTSYAETVDFGANDNNAGNQYFTQDNQTYFGTGRIDATLTQKIRVFGSWLYQYARETGAGSAFPIADPEKSESGYLNTAVLSPLTLYSHGIGFSSPNATYNTGADITLTPRIVSTTRLGYFFQNYHDFGWPTSVTNLDWNTSGIGVSDNTGAPLPAALQEGAGTTTVPYDSSYTLFNTNKHYQFDEDVAFFKSGWWGTHNFKFGYQLNRLSNLINQNGNVPQVFLNIGPTGSGISYTSSTTTGAKNCDLLKAEWGACTGQYGYAVVQDFATILNHPAVDWNHGLFAQDSWTIARGLTLNLGIRVEKETLPVPPGSVLPGVTPPSSINFSWGDKIAPRLGAAWGSQDGKLKIFGSYGVVNDVMKLLLAQSSWGAQAYEQCSYPLGPDTKGTFTDADINAVFINNRACPNAVPTVGANFAGGVTPPSLIDTKTGVSLIENVNFRPLEPVAPNVKPYRQHEYVGGVDYQLGKAWALEARYDRRRLDHVIEDASLSDRIFGELYTVVNPGQGVDKTIDSYASYLTSIGKTYGVPGEAFNDTKDYGPSAAFGTCPSCPANPIAIRNYDAVEVRLTHSTSRRWNGMFSYTYSRLWGNYTGLTTTDQTDGGTPGRNSPDTTRSFDEPFYYFGANGKSTDGVLPTDRPNVFKGNVYYALPWAKHQTTTFGLFQYFYQGSPMSSFIDLTKTLPNLPYEPTYIFGRGNWVNMIQDAVGDITLSTPYVQRTPWYIQSDFNASHSIRTGEHQALAFSANIINLFNQRAVTAYYEGLNSTYFATPLYPGYDPVTNGPINLASGAALYRTLESGYNPQQWINGVPATSTNAAIPRVIGGSLYDQPFRYQLSRNIRLGVNYTF